MERNKNLNYITYTIIGTIEVVLLIRLLLKLIGADASNAIVNGFYTITNFIVTPFNNFVGQVELNGARENMIFEPGNILAIIIIIFIGWVIIDITSIKRIKQKNKNEN